jgi:hypothetical protein
MKTAFALLPYDRLQQYPYFRELLLTNNLDLLVKDWAKAIESWNPVPSSVPRAYIFQKYNSGELLFTHVFVLYVQHQIFQLVLPFNVTERDTLGGKHIDQLICPALFQQNVAGNPLYEVVHDFSAVEPCKEEGVMYFKFNPDHLKNLQRFNPDTGEFSSAELKPDEIVKLFFSRDLN